MRAVLLLIILITSVSSSGHAQVLGPEGGEFQVSAQTTLYNTQPSVAMQSSGDFVVVWKTYRETSPGNGIVGRRYASDGSSIGGEFIVSDSLTGSSPRVTVSPTGAFVVVWVAVGDPVDTQGGSIQARRFDAQGQARGSQFRVNSYTTSTQVAPDVEIDDQGAFVAVWRSFGSDGDDNSSSSIQMRRFDSAGLPIGDDVQVNDYTTSIQLNPAITRVGDDFIVAWSSDGSLGDDQSGTSIQARRLGSDGSFIGDSFQVNVEGEGAQRGVALATDAEDRFLVAWTSEQGALSDEVRARLYDSAGTPQTGEIAVNSLTAGRQRVPAVAAGADGHFMVVWESDVSAGSNGSGSASVQLGAISADGSRVGEDFQVNTYTPDSQEAQVIAGDGQGRFVVSWMSYGSDTSEAEEATIQAQRYRQVEVTGRVWLDLDIDGLQDDGEGGLENVRVDLFDTSADLVGSAMTDSDGNYSIFPTTVGEYYVAVEPSLPYTFTPQDQGDDTIDSDVDPQSGSSADFQLTGRSRVDAGLINGLGDRVWLDEDGDGLQDETEPGIAGLAVSLLEAGVGVVAQTTTDDQGRYVFSDLAPGSYSVAFTPPAGFVFSPQNEGDDDTLDSDVDPSTGETAVILFENGHLDLDLDAGLRIPPLFADGFESGDLSAWSSSNP